MAWREKMKEVHACLYVTKCLPPPQKKKHYGRWQDANKMTKIINFDPIGPIRLKIGQRCGFPPEITHNKFQLNSFNV